MPQERPKEASIRGSNRSTPLPGLRDARKRRGLTQRELAALAGTGAGTVSDLEVGRRGGYPATVKRLCLALGVTPAQLMTVEHLSEQEQTHCLNEVDPGLVYLPRISRRRETDLRG